MSRIGFLTANRLTASSITSYQPIGTDTSIPARVASPRPAEMFTSEDPGDGFAWEVDSGANWIDVIATSITYAAEVPAGVYTTAALEAAINAAFDAAGSGAATLEASYDAAAGRWWIHNTITGAFSVLWSTGAHAASSIRADLGFDAADLTSGGGYYADEQRFGTLTGVVYEGGSKLDVIALIAQALDVEGLEAGSPAYSTLHVYGSSYASPAIWSTWDSTGTEYTLSTRSSTTGADGRVVNPAQVALIGAVSHAYWAVLWRHQDEARVHGLGVIRGGTMRASTCRTVQELSDHAMLDSTVALGVSNYWPTSVLPRWSTVLAWRDWPASDWQEVFFRVARAGRADLVLWMLDWTDYEDGSLSASDVGDLATSGMLYFGSVVEGPSGALGGLESDYYSGDLRIEQVV